VNPGAGLYVVDIVRARNKNPIPGPASPKPIAIPTDMVSTIIGKGAYQIEYN
jgi:hypothetical protein